MEVIKGIPVSPGVVIGRAFVLDDVREHVPYQTIPEADVPSEIERLDKAIEQSTTDIELDRKRAAEKLGPSRRRFSSFTSASCRTRRFSSRRGTAFSASA
jgi:phosphoenolpyruvate-protein kinase (PTS system EI component)